MSFFDELKRRNVFRVGIAYAVTSWLLIQVSDILLESIGAPPWVMQTMFVLLAVGFVITMFIAWAFELTPEGVKKEKDVDRSASIAPKTGQKLNLGIVALLVVTLAYVAYDKLVLDDLLETGPVASLELPVSQAAHPADAEPKIEIPAVADTQKSIVVLPFVNMSSDPDQEYFSDGLSEELLNVLAQVKNLRVISRTSAFAFKGKDLSIPEIAATLNVSHVLEGSVRRSGEDVRITAQLIEVATDSHLWSDAYNRNLENVFEIQEEISKAIAHELQVTLGTSGKSGNPTENLEAYQLYLRGRDLYMKRDHVLDSVELFQQAVDLDPGFTEAWANLGATAQLASFWSDEGYREYRARSLAAIKHALTLDPDNGLAHAILGMHYQHEMRWEEALTEIDLAIELNPNESNSLLYKGEVLVMLGYTKEAIEVLKQAEIVDPVFANVQVWIIGAYLRAGEYEKAQKHITQIRQLDPYYGAYYEASLAEAQGDFSRAESLIREIETSDDETALISAAYYAALKDPSKTDESAKLIMENQEMSGWGGVFGELAGLGAVETGIDYWYSLRAKERYVRSGNYLQYLWKFPEESISDPRFVRFLEDIGIVDYWRKHGDPDYCRVDGASVECGDP